MGRARGNQEARSYELQRDREGHAISLHIQVELGAAPAGDNLMKEFEKYYVNHEWEGRRRAPVSIERRERLNILCDVQAKGEKRSKRARRILLGGGRSSFWYGLELLPLSLCAVSFPFYSLFIFFSSIFLFHTRVLVWCLFALRVLPCFLFSLVWFAPLFYARIARSRSAFVGREARAARI